MRQDFIDTQSHKADAIQANAELDRLEAETRKNKAKQKIDEELGLSSKRAEFKKRLEDLQNSATTDFKKLMAQYKNDWDDFKADMVKSYDKADRVGNAQADLLEARIDGLTARIQYLAGLQMEDNTNEAKAIQKSLEPVLQDFRSLSEEVRRAFKKKGSKTESKASKEQHH